VAGNKVPAKIEDPNSLYGFRLLDEELLDEVQVSKDEFLRLIGMDKLPALKEIMKLFDSTASKTMLEKAVFERGCIEFGEDIVDLSPLTEEEEED
jgi:hypothetical protein